MSFDCSTCDPLYVWSGFNETTCYTFAVEPATSPVTELHMSASTNSLYSQYGTKIYSTVYLPSGVGNLMSIETDLVWKNLNMDTIDGPLNRSGRWLSGTSLNNTWVGFSTCLDGHYSGKTYYVGIGCDNHFKVVVNGTEILNNLSQTALFESFIYWHIYPVTLYSGSNVVEVYGLNTTDNGSIGCEIYDNTYSQLSGATQYSDLNVVFTTSGLTGVTVVQNLLGVYQPSGYTCSEGFYYSECQGECVEKLYCEDGPPCKCLKFRIDYRDIANATGNTTNPNNTVFGVGEYMCDFTPINEEFTSSGYYCYCMTLNPPPTLCMTFSSDTYGEYTCTSVPFGFYNDKVYYQLLDTDCLTYLSLYVYWNVSNSRWECSDSLGGVTVYSYLDNPGDSPISNITYVWVDVLSTFNVSESIVGPCSEIACGIEGYGYSILTPWLMSYEIPVSSPSSIISNLGPLGYSIDLYYYENDILTYTTYSSVILTSDGCTESSECCNDICNVSGYCLSNTDNPYIDGFYINSGTYDDKPYWSGLSTNLVIYYSPTRYQWCLSTSLGGPCILAGKTPCYSSCPDFCDGMLYDGYCTTTTTLPFVDCEILDFDAIFNCHVDPTPTPTPTTTPTPTPTKGGTIPPCVITVDAEIMTYSPTPTPTPTMTPTSSGIINRNCGFNGTATFNTIDDILGCPTSHQFQDCYNGAIYYTMNQVSTPTSLSLVESMVYQSTVNGVQKCLIYLGKNNNVSGNSAIIITSESFGSTTSGGCTSCQSES